MSKLGLRFERHATVPATGQPVAVHAVEAEGRVRGAAWTSTGAPGGQ